MDFRPASTTSSSDSNVQPSDEMTMQKIDASIARLPYEERLRFIAEINKCRSENQLAGLPFACVIVGSSHFFRRKLNFGQQWAIPFYALLGIGTLAFYGIATSNNCSERLKTMLADYENKPTSKILSSQVQRDVSGYGYDSLSEFLPEPTLSGFDGYAPLLSGTPTSYSAYEGDANGPTSL